MKLVVKFAGALLEQPAGALYKSRAQQIAELARQGHKVLVVHGGGRTFTKTLARLRIESRFVEGLRVTDAETRDVALMVLGGLLNKQLAAAISTSEQPAIGISGGDATCFVAEPLSHPARLGFVGELTGVNVQFVESLWSAGLVPVSACLGLGADGEIYNINADQMAASCAGYMRADNLIYLTDVPGVLDGDRVIERVNCDEIEELVKAHKVSGGMVLKLEACRRALTAGVGDVQIVGGDIPGSLLAAAAGECRGTRVVAAVSVAKA